MTTNDVKTRKPDMDSAGSLDPDTYESRVHELAASARDLAGQIEDGSPASLTASLRLSRQSVGNAVEAARAVESMPEPTRRMLATLSLGLGAGLYLAGAPRLVTLLAFLPALLVAGTWLARDPQLRPTVH